MSTGIRAPVRGVPGPGDLFVLRVNDWPRGKAMAWWRAFDRVEVADERDADAFHRDPLAVLDPLDERFRQASPSRERPRRSPAPRRPQPL